MKQAIKILAILILMVTMFAGTASAEWGIPAEREKDGFLGEKGRSLRIGYINTLVGEGPTSDGFETYIYYQDVAADVSILMANTSGTLTVEDGSGGLTLSGADAQVLVHNGVKYEPQSMTGDGSITNALVFSLEAGTDGQIFIYNATEKWGPKTVSGDIAFTNAGASSILSNKVGAAETNYTVVVTNVASGVDTTTETVTSGAVIIGYYPVSNIVAEIVNSISISTTTLTMVLNANAASEVVYRVVVLEP